MFRPVTERIRSGGFVKQSLCLAFLAVFSLLPEISATRNAQANNKHFSFAPFAKQQAQQNTSAQQAQEVEVLEQGKPIERELAAGRNHTYQITLAEGQFLSVVVEQRGIDVVVRLQGPDGKQISEFDSEIRKQGQEKVLQVADVAGSYRLSVQVVQRGAPAGRYEIRVAELRAATEQDRALQEARKLSAESFGLFRAGKYNEARPLVERALGIRGKELGPEHPDVAQSLNNLANLYAAIGDYVKAEPLYQRALDIREKVLGPEHPNVAQSLHNLAVLYRANGDYVKAEHLYRRTLDIWEKSLGPEHPNVADTLNNLAILYRVKGDNTKAEPLLQRALIIWEKAFGPEHPSVARGLNNLANIYNDKGDYAKAEPLLQRALEIREKTLGPGHPDVAQPLHNLALLYSDKGDYGKAGPLLQRALEIREKTLGPGHPDVASSLNSLANLYSNNGNYAGAEPLYQRALDIWEKTLGLEHPDAAHAFHNLADLYNDKGEYAKAEPLLQRALTIREKSLGPEHHFVAASLGSLATLYYAKGDYAKAEPLLQRALTIFEKAFGPNHPDVAKSLNGLALLYAGKGDYAQAIAYQLRAGAINERNTALNLATGSERQKFVYLATLSAFADQTISLHIHYAPRDAMAVRLAATTTLHRKGRVLDAMADSAAALRSRFRTEDQVLLDQLMGTTTQLARLVLGGPQRVTPAEHQKQIRILEEQKERLEADISRVSAEFLVQSQPITLAAIQAAIPTNAALIEFASYQPFNAKAGGNDKVYGEPHYVAYILRRQGEILWKEMGDAKTIDDAIDAFRRALRDPKRRDVKTLARAVDEKVMQPVRALLGGATQLLISPDGALNLIPFEALVDEQGRYLIERYSVSYLTSGRDLLRLQVERESKSDPLVVADPTFGVPETGQLAKADASGRRSSARTKLRQSVTTGSDLSGVYFAPLAGTALEAREIKSLFREAQVLAEEQATEASLKQAAAPQILHIATHGFFLGDQPVKIEGTRGLSWAQGDGNLGGLSANLKIENPLLRSGLALAGANLRKSGDEDGILTALEASGLNLWGTKLVVLSACDTGLGVVKTGEGVYGLRRALVLAGSETQVMSLWPVSDYVTRRLMKAYYAGLKQGQGRGEALRRVKLEMLRRQGMEHPFYWASFIQSGEWDQLEVKR